METIAKEKTKTLTDIIQKKRNNLKCERLDMSFGELISLYRRDELIISPEYQRAFRWDKFQQTRFIESLLLGIPVPPVFVAEDSNDGTWELIDGLQRLSTVFSFFGLLEEHDKNNNLVLEKGELVEELENVKIEDLHFRLLSQIRRAICRVEILKSSDTNVDMRYELFNRLNTGGTSLSDQEIRNCIIRGHSNELNAFLIKIGTSGLFKKLIKPSDNQLQEMYCEELVLRYLTFKNGELTIEKNLQYHLTQYMKRVSLGKEEFDIIKEEDELIERLEFLEEYSEERFFRAANGILAPHYYDAIMLSLNKYYEYYKKHKKEFLKKIKELKEDKKYEEKRSYAYSINRTEVAIKRAFEIFKPNE